MKCFISRICQLPLPLLLVISAQVHNNTAPYSLRVIMELEANARVTSLHFLLPVIKPADTCELLLASHRHPGILSTCYLHLCPGHYLFWQSPFLLATFLKVNIFSSAMGLTPNIRTRLGSWGEINRVHLSSQMLVCIYGYDREKWMRKLLLLLFHSGKTKCLTGFHLTLFISF